MLLDQDGILEAVGDVIRQVQKDLTDNIALHGLTAARIETDLIKSLGQLEAQLKDSLEALKQKVAALPEHDEFRNFLEGRILESERRIHDAVVLLHSKLSEIRNGVDGKDGRDGVDGLHGKDGRDGIDGLNGKDGRDGTDGKDGVEGPPGKDGRDGIDGKDGAPGRDGDRGLPGVDGKDGKDGEPGQPGTPGRDGDPGVKGDKGDPGEPGQRGERGERGLTGPQGFSLTPMGKWDAGRIYKTGDIVQWEGTSWWVLQDTVVGDEPTKSDRFSVVVTRPKNGKDGVRGKDGRDGIDGRDGADGRNAPLPVEIRLIGKSFNFVFDDGSIIQAEASSFLKDLEVDIRREAVEAIRSELIGEIKMFAGPKLPANFLWCDGQLVPKKFSDLISVAGSKTPDLRGSVPSINFIIRAA
jgi:hypothetical protein